MPNKTTGLADLQLTVQRLVDADLLLEEEAEPLLSEIEAALLSTEGADQETVSRLVDRLARLAVVNSSHLEPADGRIEEGQGLRPRQNRAGNPVLEETDAV